MATTQQLLIKYTNKHSIHVIFNWYMKIIKYSSLRG